jgi:hypothetical protein
VTIPVSLVGAFALMLVLGFTINTLTLLALVLAIGLVVDDAIVVLENIYRHIEEGMPRHAGGVQGGAQEIGFAVVAMTLTLAAVYAPVAFMTGRTGKLFIEFALTLAGAVLVSGFVALTLSPMMCSLLLRHEEKHGKAFSAGRALPELADAGYKRVLTAALARRWIIMLVSCWSPPRRRLLKAEVRAGAGRGSRHHPRHLCRAGRRDARLHRQVRPADRGHLQPDQGRRALLRGRRQPDRQPGHLLRRPDRLEAERTAARRSRQGTVPQVHGHSRRAGLSRDAALARPEPARAAGQFRHRHLGFLRGTAAA